MPQYKATLHITYSVTIDVEDEAETLGAFLGATEARALAGAYDECAFEAIRKGECRTADVEILNFERRSEMVPAAESVA